MLDNICISCCLLNDIKVEATSWSRLQTPRLGFINHREATVTHISEIQVVTSLKVVGCRLTNGLSELNLSDWWKKAISRNIFFSRRPPFD